MLCPQCGNEGHRVIFTEKNIDSNTIRRVRQCVSCGMSFTTREAVSRETKCGYVALESID